MIALNAVDPDGHQKIGFGLCFHPFCHSEHLELVRDRDQGLGKYLVIRIKKDVVNEMAVNFDLVQEEVLKIPKRRQTSAKII